MFTMLNAERTAQWCIIDRVKELICDGKFTQIAATSNNTDPEYKDPVSVSEQFFEDNKKEVYAVLLKIEQNQSYSPAVFQYALSREEGTSLKISILIKYIKEWGFANFEIKRITSP
jgi:hypothetical protein